MDYLPERNISMTNFNDFLKEQRKDPNFKAEWEALDSEFSAIEANLKAQKTESATAVK